MYEERKQEQSKVTFVSSTECWVDWMLYTLAVWSKTESWFLYLRKRLGFLRPQHF